MADHQTSVPTDSTSTFQSSGPAAHMGPRLVLDEAALRQQLRHAFAADFTVVQELVQNARRAGASEIQIDYNADQRSLTITDDGCGIEDFRTLLTFAASGWNTEVAAAERPYGMGFMAAIYAATHVAVTSRGQRLSFDTATLLDGGTARIEYVDQVDARGTKVCLQGITLHDPNSAIERLSAGYPIPLTYQGKAMSRPHALDVGSFVATEVGHMQLGSTFTARGLSVYLQGFLVFQDRWSRHCSATVVHLDGSRYRGKFPDRDRVIDHDRMLADVEAVVRQLFVGRLEAMRSSLSDADFCEKAYYLAESLDRLDIFNAVDCIPGAWFVRLQELPHSTVEGEDPWVAPSPGFISRQSVECGAFPVAPFSYLHHVSPIGDTLYDVDLRRWTWAYLAGQHLLCQRLHPDHWVFRAMAAADVPVQLDLDVAHRGQVPEQRCAAIGGARLLACQRLEMHTLEGRHSIHEAIAAVIDGELCLLVPRASADGAAVIASQAGGWAHITRNCLRQCYSYSDQNDQLECNDLELDEAAASTALDLLVSPTPLAYLQRVVGNALHSYRDELKQFGAIQLKVADGVVSVTSFVEASPGSPSAP